MKWGPYLLTGGVNSSKSLDFASAGENFSPKRKSKSPSSSEPLRLGQWKLLHIPMITVLPLGAPEIADCSRYY